MDLYASKEKEFKEKTGKSMKEWKKDLDKWGSIKKGHKKTVEYLQKKHDIKEKWAEAISVRYQKDKYM